MPGGAWRAESLGRVTLDLGPKCESHVGSGAYLKKYSLPTVSVLSAHSSKVRELSNGK